MSIKRALAAAGMLIFAWAIASAQADDGVRAMPKPGETPRPQKSITIQSAVQIDFDSPFSPGYAALRNPSTASGPIYYTLCISVAELQRRAGITGYDEETYAELVAQPNYDPEASRILLCQTEPIEPGGIVSAITLGVLPDGSTLPAGEYQGELQPISLEEQSVSSDPKSDTPATADVVVYMNLAAKVPFTVKTGLARLSADADGFVRMRIFNPANSGAAIIYCLQVSQGEIERVSGESCRTAAELAEQKLNLAFNADYEFLSLFTSEPIAPGGFLTEASLGSLPNGKSLSSGTYTGWLVRYVKDPDTDGLTMLDINTQVQLEIP